MNKKTKHLYSLIGITFVMLFMIQIFFDKIPQDADNIVKSKRNYSKTSSNNIKEYNPIIDIKIDKEKISLNKGDNRYIYTNITYGNQTDFANEELIWKSNDESIATVNQNGVITGVANGSTAISVSSKSGQIHKECQIFVKKTKYVALTFDDGPGAYTEKLLRTLDHYHCKATFFVCGYKIQEYTATLKLASEYGMEIGNHSYSHADFRKMNTKQIKQEINRNKKLIKQIIGHTPTLVRPPYGVTKQSVRKVCDVPIIMWSVDTKDWNHQNTNYLYRYITTHAHDGEIILLHDIHKKTVQSVIQALPLLLDNGVEPVTVSELYHIKGVELKNKNIYHGNEYLK